MNTFRFWPVGQGLFYTGSIMNGDFNFVYDCGSNDDNYINKCIDAYLDTIIPSSTIDFVVISHMHYDHFSGLWRLADKAKIKKLYLPYLGNDKNIITLILANAVFGEAANGARENLYRIYNFMLHLYNVESETNNEFPNIETVFINDDYTIHKDNDSFYSLLTSHKVNNYWKFSLIAKQISTTTYATLNAQISALLKVEKVSCILDLVNTDTGVNKVINIYNTVFKKKQNPTSIILVHQPLNNLQTFFTETNLFDKDYFYCNASFFYNKICPQNICNLTTRRNITLLTGDACFDKNIISIVTNELNNNTAFITQVPHHGAKTEWYRFEKGKFNTLQYVIPYGLGNTYRHPNKETVDEILSKGSKLISVTQNEGYIYWID
ncbi:MAG: MBL fold metallo-hydrolase [Ruminococcus sp.]|nr:MBL fold metallo-hydrolase [Ruminococcus sp.]